TDDDAAVGVYRLGIALRIARQEPEAGQGAVDPANGLRVAMGHALTNQDRAVGIHRAGNELPEEADGAVDPAEGAAVAGSHRDRSVEVHAEGLAINDPRGPDVGHGAIDPAKGVVERVAGADRDRAVAAHRIGLAEASIRQEAESLEACGLGAG